MLAFSVIYCHLCNTSDLLFEVLNMNSFDCLSKCFVFSFQCCAFEMKDIR